MKTKRVVSIKLYPLELFLYTWARCSWCFDQSDIYYRWYSRNDFSLFLLLASQPWPFSTNHSVVPLVSFSSLKS